MDRRFEVWRSECESYTELRSASKYARLTPNIFNLRSNDDSLKRRLLLKTSEREVDVPPQDIYLLSNCFLSDLTLSYTSDEVPLGISTIDHSRIYTMEELRAHGSEIPAIDIPVSHIFKAGKNNYGHLLVEILPKMLLLFEAGLKNTKLIVPSLSKELAKVLFDVNHMLFDDSFSFYSMRTPLVQATKVHYVGPVSKHNDRKSQIVIDFADKLMEHCPEGLFPEKIYVSRVGVKKRQMINENAIESWCVSHGYEVVRPETLSLAEQIGMFSRARSIIGPLGAGMTNIIFARKDCQVTLIDNGAGDFFFFDLSNLRGQEFNWVFSHELTYPNDSNLHASYTVDASQINSCLATVERT